MLSADAAVLIREIQEPELPLLEDFLYEAIFVPEGIHSPPRSIIHHPEAWPLIDGFGTLPSDHCLVAETSDGVVGAVWARTVKAYGYLDERTPLLSISLLPGYRGRGIGTALLGQMLDDLRSRGYQRVSLSVQRANPALRLYCRAGFVVHHDDGDELVMVRELAGADQPGAPNPG